MPFDLEAEIARRLNVSPDAIAPVLDAVIERIRQQVSHYGYARLAGLGTFRSQNGDIAFEPDPVLSENVNLRFGGLEEVRVAPVGADEQEEEPPEEVEADEDDTVYGDSPGDDYDRTDSDSDDERGLEDESDPIDYDYEDVDVEDEHAPPPTLPIDSLESDDELETPEGAESIDEAPSTAREPFPWDEDDTEAAETVEGDMPGVTWADEDDDSSADEIQEEDAFQAEGDYRIDEEDLIDDGDLIDEEDLIDGAPGTVSTWEDEPEDADADEMDEAETWLGRPDEDHPLGPVTEGPFEEADYSVLEDQRSAAHEDFEEDEMPYAGDDLEDEFEVDDEYDDADAFEDDYAFEDADAEEIDAFGDEFTDDVDGGGPTVAWNPLEDEPESNRFADEEEAVGGGAAFDDDDAHEDEASHEKAPDRTALPHERIRQHPPRRHAAAHASEGGAAGGNRNALWIGVGVVVIVAAVAVIYFIITPTAPTDDAAITEQVETPVLGDTAAAAAADATASDTTATTVPPAVEEEIEESTPLRSPEGVDPAAGGFTIIVYSQTSRSGADDAAARYRDAGFRTSVLEYQESGATRYRVGVGQFTTLDEAAEVRERLAGEELPEDAWVRRVR